MPDAALRFLDAAQVASLVGAVPRRDILAPRDRAILELFWSTGLRVAELCSLDRTQVPLTGGGFSVLGKGRKWRLCFVSDAAAVAVAIYLAGRPDDSPALFLSTKGPGVGRRITPRSVQRLVAKYRTRAALPVAATPHTLRHSFATDLLANGAGLREVQEMLGHARISTTQIYTHVTNPQLAAAHARFHSRG